MDALTDATHTESDSSKWVSQFGDMSFPKVTNAQVAPVLVSDSIFQICFSLFFPILVLVISQQIKLNKATFDLGKTFLRHDQY